MASRGQSTDTGTRVGLVLIGDELLTGKRRDKHMPAVIERLGRRGMGLAWVRIVSDDSTRLEAALRETLAGDDIVLCFGGIGATPDDRTRQCAAAAAGAALEVHPEGRAILEDKFGDSAYPQRIHMVEWPAGARLIPNPVNRVPGFSYADHHFVPGFPRMAWPMVEWVLDNQYPYLQRGAPDIEWLLEAHDTPESALAATMQRVMDAHPRVRIACLPNADGRRAIEFGVRGQPGAVHRAYAALAQALEAQGVPIRRVPT